MFTRFLYRSVIVMLLLVVSACSGGSNKSGGIVTVNITMDEYSFTSSLTTFKVGTTYHFVVKNNGQLPHEIMLMQPVEAGKMSMEDMDDMALMHIDEDDLPAGATATMDYTFTEPASAGTLEFACHLAGHYEAGMKLPIVVQ